MTIENLRDDRLSDPSLLGTGRLVSRTVERSSSV